MAARTSASQAALACFALGAPAIRACAAGLASATALEGEAFALLALHALDHGRVGVDGDEPAGRIDERRIAEAQREIVRLAEQHDQIGLLQHLGEGAEARIVDAARAFHRHDGNAERVLELRAAAQIAGMAELRAGQDQRAAGAGQRREDRMRPRQRPSG